MLHENQPMREVRHYMRSVGQTVQDTPAAQKAQRAKPIQTIILINRMLLYYQVPERSSPNIAARTGTQTRRWRQDVYAPRAARYVATTRH